MNAKRLLSLVVLIGLGYGAYRFHDSISNFIRRPTVVDAANTQTPPGNRGGRGGGRGAGPGGTAVVALAARKADMPIYLRGLGSVSPYSSVTVRSRVDGQLLNVAFSEGRLVSVPRPFAHLVRGHPRSSTQAVNSPITSTNPLIPVSLDTPVITFRPGGASPRFLLSNEN